MADIPLRLRELLADDELATALLALVSDGTPAGETRKYSIAKLAAALHAVNALEVVWESETLFEDLTSSAPDDTNFSETYNLDFKSGNSGPRHNFTDGYAFFELHIYPTSSATAATTLPANMGLTPSLNIINASETAPYAIYPGGGIPSTSGETKLAFARNTNTSFKMAGGGAGDNIASFGSRRAGQINRIVGWKMVIRPSSL